MKERVKHLGYLVLGAVLLTHGLNSYPKEDSRKINEKKIIEEFTKAYASKNKPRLTIAVNRELSEEVSEYKVSSKMAAEITGKVKTSPKEKTGQGGEVSSRNLLPTEESAKPEDQGVKVAEPAKTEEAKPAEPEKVGSGPEAKAETKPAAEEKGNAESLDSKPAAGESKGSKPSEAKPAESKSEAAVLKEAKPEEAKKPEADSQEKKPEAAKTETAAKEEKKPEPGKQTEAVQAKPEENKAEAAKPEQPKPDEAKKTETSGASAEPKELETEPAAQEEKKSEPVQPAATAPAQAKPEPAPPAEAKPEEAKAEATPAPESAQEMSKQKVAQAMKQAEPNYETGSSDSAAMAMKMETVEIRSDLPEKEREAIFSEGVMWKFQNAFVEPFLAVKAKVVDRATIIRQTGLEEMKGKSIQEVDRMAIEMNALNKYADVYIEILIAQEMNSASGFIFKADAKDLKSGELVAHTVYEGLVKEATKNVVVNPKTGRTAKKKVKVLDVENSARNLALLIMQDMTKTWSE